MDDLLILLVSESISLVYCCVVEITASPLNHLRLLLKMKPKKMDPLCDVGLRSSPCLRWCPIPRRRVWQMQCDVDGVNFSHGPLWLKPQHSDRSQESSFKVKTCDFAALLELVWTQPNGQSGPGAELPALAEANKWLDKQIIVSAFWCGCATSARELKIPSIQSKSTTSHVILLKYTMTGGMSATKNDVLAGCLVSSVPLIGAQW